MSDPNKDVNSPKNVIRIMDGDDSGRASKNFRRDTNDRTSSRLEDDARLIDFDAKIHAAIPPVSSEMSARLDDAYRRAVADPGRNPIERETTARRRRLGIWAGITVSIAAGVYLLLHFSGHREVPLDFDFAVLDATRSTGEAESISYRMTAVLGEAAYWYVFERDEHGQVHMLFPFFDPESESWHYLGYDNNHFEAGTTVLLPRPGTLGALVATGNAGATEYILAVANRDAIPLDELSRFAGEIEDSFSTAIESYPSDAEFLRQLERSLQSRFDAVKIRRRTYE